MAAWFVGKWYGVSLQKMNSGNLGARNAGRTLGKGAFCVTFAVDVMKGILVVILGRGLSLDEFTISIGVLICILGHLFPFWLRFKGGKGVATMIGGLSCLNPYLFLTLLFGTLISLPFTKSLTWSMLFGFITYSTAILLMKLPEYSPLMISFLCITWKHHENLKKKVI